MANTPRLKAAALLDFDQTLVDLPVDWEALRGEIAGIFRAHGIETNMRPFLASMRQSFADLEARGYSAGERAAIRRAINRLLTTYELAAALKARAMPGARELIETLRSRSMKVIIQSSNSIHAIEQSLARLAFPKIDAIIGRESARRPKPDPQGVRRVLRRLGLRGDQCIVVGDGDFDVELGRAIGAVTICVGQGGAAGADHHVRSLDEASSILFGRVAA
jgi:HAD superfamily hydrolase (TIGR01509 family)